MPRYQAFGLRFDSDLDLPELGLEDVDQSGAPDIVIRIEPVLRQDSTIPYLGMQIAVTPASIFLDIPEIGRFKISAERISVEADTGASQAEIRIFLLGSALGALFYQRGYLPLHANAIVAGDGAIAFAGQSGAGKSTLAAYFQNRGFSVLCDDVCLVTFDKDGRGGCWPGLRRLKLREDSLLAFGHKTPDFSKIGERFDKYNVPISGDELRGPFALRRFYVLQESGLDEPGPIRRLAGSDAINAITSNLYRRRLGELCDPARLVRQAVMLLEQVEIFAVSRRWGLNHLQSEGLRLEEHFQSGA